MMWGFIISSYVVIMAIVLSLGKASSRREEIANKKREELLERKNSNFFSNSKKNIK